MTQTPRALLAIAVFVGQLSGGSAFADWLDIPTSIAKTLLPTQNFSVKDYQIGSEWGKKKVTQAVLAQSTPAFQRAALATASYGGGTAFYLGTFNGHHLMGTNHHVQPEMTCSAIAQFPLLGQNHPCSRVLGTWPTVDFAVFEIEVASKDEASLEAVAKNLSFDRPVTQGETLLTVGFGIAGNPYHDVMANQDSDCKVFSPTDEFKLMADPDEVNPGDYSAWSFANGCDVSHGDSGSAFVDRQTGDVLGLIWTGRIPKSAGIDDSGHLDEVMLRQTAEVWTELSYAVPAVKIRELIRQYLKTPNLSSDVRDTLEALIH